MYSIVILDKVFPTDNNIDGFQLNLEIGGGKASKELCDLLHLKQQLRSLAFAYDAFIDWHAYSPLRTTQHTQAQW